MKRKNWLLLTIPLRNQLDSAFYAEILTKTMKVRYIISKCLTFCEEHCKFIVNVNVSTPVDCFAFLPLLGKSLGHKATIICCNQRLAW